VSAPGGPSPRRDGISSLPLLFFHSTPDIPGSEMIMNEMKLGRALGAAAMMLVLGAPLPALAIDEGHDDTTMSAPAPSKAKPAKPAGPTLATARADIAAKNWTLAISDLRKVIAANPKSADAYSLLGYSYRNAGNTDRAGQAYTKALQLNPKHTGALEYQGILFIKLGQTDKAMANLAKIKTIEGSKSEAYADLAKALGV
jgi:Flp pilus assembly protein TadD